MLTFKRFVTESGNATSKWGTVRANQDDIISALKFVAKNTSLPLDYLKANLLGSTELTLLGKRADSGDIDVAIKIGDYDPEKTHHQLMAALKDEGVWNKGTMVGSYAVPANDKKVPFDLMYVKNPEWAKFAYHSSEGHKSEYKGAVRNILLSSVAKFRQVPGEDFVALDDNGDLIARASRSWKMDTGLERLFKITKTGPRGGKKEEKVSPEELRDYLVSLDPKYKDAKFSNKAEIIDDPEQVAKHLFGPNIKAKDIMTVEQVLELLNDPSLFSKALSKKIISDASTSLAPLGFTLPPELKK